LGFDTISSSPTSPLQINRASGGILAAGPPRVIVVVTMGAGCQNFLGLRVWINSEDSARERDSIDSVACGSVRS